uniref:Long-chain-fatty-acid--CoA ligase n=1 Tax=Mastacembelus armatus TaxID=205130 RepID=A0A7N8WRG2_9TELE
MLSQELFQKLRFPDLDDVSEYIRSVSTPMVVSMGAVAAATTYYLATRPKPLPPACDLHMQSVEVPGGDLARRSVLQNEDGHLTHFYDDARTMYEFFLRGARVSINGPCLGSRKPKQPYEWMSYRQWTISELACYTYSLVSVPLYDTLGTEAIAYIIDKASISTIVCDVVDKVNLVLDCDKSKKNTVKTIVVMETPSADLVSRGQQAGIHILSLQEMEALGKANYHQPVPPQPEDMAVICFTSGTTGAPKGAMLTHGNIVSNCSAFIKMTKHCCPMMPSDIHISFLPLAHMFERVAQCVMIVHGARIGFFQGDIRFLSDDLTTLRPTVFPVVPRLLNRMYDKIFGQADTSLKRWLLGFAYRRKEAEMMKGTVRRDSIWDRLIFRKVQASLGGRVRLIMTGAAPISPTVLTFLRAAIGCQFYEGYGQTECTAGCTMTLSGDWTAGHVGAPLPCNWIKLVDVPEMNYLAVNGEGEVCVKGTNVFQGYLKDPEKTAETIDADGWPLNISKCNGTLKIVDRKKHIFKLAQGEYIAPEKIEGIYMRSDAVAQVFVHGDSLQACLVAVVVPDPDFLSGWTKRTLGVQGSYQKLCDREDVKMAILDDMLRLGKEGGLKSFEQVKAIYIHTELFSVENGLLTPTMKAKSNEIQHLFRPQIDELYAGIKM